MQSHSAILQQCSAVEADLARLQAAAAQLRQAVEAGGAGALRPPAEDAEEPRPSAFRWAAGEKERVALRPIRHDDLWQFRKKIEGLHWIAQEVDMKRDKADWDTRMTADERHFVRCQLAFFARVDIDVLDNLGANFAEEVDCLEAKMVYAAQEDQECAHAESYALQIESVMTGAERDATLRAVETMPVIAKLRSWALQWLDRRIAVGERLVAWAFVEGVQFQGPFCGLQWLRERNLLPGITLANTFIMRDENIHSDTTCLLVRKYLRERPARARVAAIFSGGMAVVDELVAESLPSGLIGLNSALMKEHVRHRADSILARMGYEPLYHAPEPFEFMAKLEFNEVEKVNFFEHQVSQYQNVTREGASRFALDDTPVPTF